MLAGIVSAVGARVSEGFRRTAPDPFVLAVLLTVVAFVLSFAFGDWPERAARGTALLDAWRADDGLWRFLGFSMQMCLVLVTGHALAASPPVARLVRRVAALPRSGAQAAAVVGLTACVFGLVNWGLGLIVGAILARETGRELTRRGVAHHYPLLVAAGYMGMLVWHGGLSGSAPVSMTSAEGAAKVLPPQTLATLGNAGIPLDRTLLSGLNGAVCAGLLLLVPAVLWLLSPRESRDCVPAARQSLEAEPSEAGRASPTASASAGARRTVPEWLEGTRWAALLLAVMLAAAVARFVWARGAMVTGLNEINMAMLALGLAAHGSIGSYARAAEDGARGCAGIILQFPLYAGILAMLSESGLIAGFSRWIAGVSTEGTLPLLTFLSAGVVNLFVPSGGGQWGVQGPIVLEAGARLGVDPGKLILAVAYGDQLTNMLQPFWALPLLAITGARARDIVGYTAVVMVVAAVWIAAMLMVF